MLNVGQMSVTLGSNMNNVCLLQIGNNRFVVILLRLVMFLIIGLLPGNEIVMLRIRNVP